MNLLISLIRTSIKNYNKYYSIPDEEELFIQPDTRVLYFAVNT